ncbi:hypothetical protein QRX25_11730 [Bacillus sp. L381]|nr:MULTISPECIES: hypothetical protein [Bacillus]WIX20326.1 hypothetical protein QRX25_11730 [Bacillus sp. L381]
MYKNSGAGASDSLVFTSKSTKRLLFRIMHGKEDVKRHPAIQLAL